jgi:phospholipid-binding lipoprotein MlaA
MLIVPFPPFLRLALTVLAGFALLAMLASCGPTRAVAPGEPFDPFEAENRQMHAFNKSLDRNVIRPVAQGYTAFVPDDVETLIRRFAFHVSIPRAIVSNMFRGNMKAATEDLYRFTVNSTLGLGGFFDPATELNMPVASDADFGQTLHAWGVPAGAYVELPFLGPSTERHTLGRAVDFFLGPQDFLLSQRARRTLTGVYAVSLVGDRARLGGTIDELLYESADSYAQVRSLYLQNRAFKLGDGGADAYLDPYDDPYDQ